METKKQTVRPLSYLGLINQFWRIDKTTQFSPAATRVFFYLLDVANSTGWESIFFHADKRAAANCGMGLTTFKNARQSLADAGLLQFASGGHGYASKTKYAFGAAPFDAEQGAVTAIPNLSPSGDNRPDSAQQGARQGAVPVIPNPSPLYIDKTKTKNNTSAADANLSLSVPDDGVSRNFTGLQNHLQEMGASDEEKAMIYRLSNFGQIGNPVWRLLADIRRSGGNIRQPLRFIISRLSTPCLTA